jgi:hypothetical protein
VRRTAFAISRQEQPLSLPAAAPHPLGDPCLREVMAGRGEVPPAHHDGRMPGLDARPRPGQAAFQDPQPALLLEALCLIGVAAHAVLPPPARGDELPPDRPDGAAQTGCFRHQAPHRQLVLIFGGTGHRSCPA